MAAISGPFKSSANAGQLSEDLAGKVNLKQYYSGALVMKGFEPIPQSGFANLPGSFDIAALRSDILKAGVLKVQVGLSYTLVFTPGYVDIWRYDRVKVAEIAIAAITSAMVPDLEFFGEANTFGIFHQDLNDGKGYRLLRNSTNDTVWTLSDWPWEYIPDVDLGGSYTKTNDIWDIYIRWADGVNQLTVSVKVDGNTTSAVRLLNTDGTPAAPGGGSDIWNLFAANLQAAINTLAGFEADVAVAYVENSDNYRRLTVTFSGSLAGDEYDFDVQVVNTSSASALVAHVQIGETDGEALISSTRGGFRGMGIYQDRGIYISPKAKQAAVAMSQTGEYFTLNIKNTADSGARLEALRTSTSETVLHVLDNTYLVLFTDQAEWFASNRTIERNAALNWVRASEVGSKKNCKPVSVDGMVFFVSADGGALYSVSYDAVSESYNPTRQNDLSKDLVRDIANQMVQRKIAGSTSTRIWHRRDDGRMACIIVNKMLADEQTMIAAAEWGVHGGGTVLGHCVDGQEQVWVMVKRGGATRLEVLAEAADTVFQATLTVSTNAGGVASGLGVLEGQTVWIEANSNFDGPFTVVGGQITTDFPSASLKVGLWEPPVCESMPYVRVNQDDTVVRRPGQVKALDLYVIDTDSIAIGANGRPARNIPLSRMTDDLTAPWSGYTGHLIIAGLNGVKTGPTLTITQTRPGRLRLRDYVPKVKL
ncbi:hypothetical protein GOZ80_14090 [Agrobacterium vitis]|uniref:Uncharacterized protein n=1 Tax=Agrobacterium vitis TaxID=373 RepID=A0A1S2DZ07_AGRVI|nr:hypothetical protein [Agrobacterium vitis]KAA3526125.1 hypothetical protein DXT89_16505 [Agrobacterium vitis]MUO96606.1 hypothetical protein [Agrobacterium vitis]MUZ99365.1 hypothetical protein [Agrobacterium vitis]MVA93137.1 hypothetical protein [Agrobacterium vitis]MVB04016.1 hypothetical protein [Agrobacterium vitis]